MDVRLVEETKVDVMFVDMILVVSIEVLEMSLRLFKFFMPSVLNFVVIKTDFIKNIKLVFIKSALRFIFYRFQTIH